MACERETTVLDFMRWQTARWASLVLVAVLAGGCDDFLDVNEDPNAPVNARVEVRLPAVVAGMVHSVYYGDPPLWTVEWMQQTSFNRATRNYDELHLYEVQDNSPNEWWTFYFAGVLNETKLMMQETDPETDAAYHGIARFISAWTWATATDLWGPIPFTGALDPGNPTPAYDDQQVVYDAIDPWFEEAITLMKRAISDGSIRRPAANDLLFEGDMSRWVRLARHLQARHRLRLSNAPWANAQEQAQAALDALQEGLASNADDVDFSYVGEDGGRNPLWLFQDNGDIFKVGQHIVDMLQARNDPRIPIMLDPALSDGGYRGHANAASPEPDSSISQVGVYFTAEDAPVNVASYAEAKFIEAEAMLILSGAGSADNAYRAAIRANMEKWGVAGAAIDAYIAALAPLSSVPNPLEEIIREKYIANYLKIEAWHDWRRTGFPQLEPVPAGVLAGIPVRIRTPSSELANNGANVMATGIDAGLAGMLYKGANVWWGGN
jgi:hypothetical protein